MYHNPHCMNPAHYGVPHQLNPSCMSHNPYGAVQYGQATDQQVENLQSIIKYVLPVLILGGAVMIYQEMSKSKQVRANGIKARAALQRMRERVRKQERKKPKKKLIASKRKAGKKTWSQRRDDYHDQLIASGLSDDAITTNLLRWEDRNAWYSGYKNPRKRSASKRRK
jgi:hypothetical protein